MVLGLKPMGKLIALDKYLIVGQSKGPVWILEPKSLKGLITLNIYLSDEQNLEGVRLLGSPTLFTIQQRCKLLEPPTLEESPHTAKYLSVRQNQGLAWSSDSNL